MTKSYGPGDPGYDVFGNGSAPPSNSFDARSLLTPETISGLVSLAEYGAQIHTVREQEKTKRLELELHYKSRAEKVAKDMEQLRSAMLQQYTNDADYQRESFAIMHKLIDAGVPGGAVEIYRMLVDKARRPVMDYLIEFYDKIVLGKVRMERDSHNNTQSS